MIQKQNTTEKCLGKKKLKRLTERATKASVLKADIKLEKGDIDTTTQRNGGNIQKIKNNYCNRNQFKSHTRQ